MDDVSKNIQIQFEGYKNTPLLWKSNLVFGISQFKITEGKAIVFNAQLSHNLRLGKRVERFVSQELSQDNEIEIILENVQVQQEQRTLGELDCILIKNDIPIHLEIVYKFYLYDSRSGNAEIDCWVGPNRNDTLLKKLTKLKEKQFPLLYSKYTKPILYNAGMIPDSIRQEVCFKAQLFVPYKKDPPKFKLLNKDCLNGYFIRHTEIEQLKDCKFYIPIKVDWLIEVHTHVKWLNFETFTKKILALVNQKTSPLCWVKYPNGTIQKFFVVWWK